MKIKINKRGVKKTRKKKKKKNSKEGHISKKVSMHVLGSTSCQLSIKLKKKKKKKKKALWTWPDCKCRGLRQKMCIACKATNEV